MAETPVSRHQPYVPASSTMVEFSLRALLLGLVMCVVLGAANAYLGLKAGMTIAATYPAAVIGMAVLRLVKARCSRRTSREPSARSANRSRPPRSHHPGLRDPEHLALREGARPDLRVPHRHGADDPRRPARHHVRDHPAPVMVEITPCPSPNRWPPPRSTRPASGAPRPQPAVQGDGRRRLHQAARRARRLPRFERLRGRRRPR